MVAETQGTKQCLTASSPMIENDLSIDICVIQTGRCGT